MHQPHATVIQPAPQPQRFVVVGHPIAHSRSPAIHQHFANQLGISLQYQTVLAPQSPLHFAQTLRTLQAAGVVGANITVPFKAQAYKTAQHHSPHAQAVQVANTLYFAPNGAIHAHNTDGQGLSQHLQQCLQHTIQPNSMTMAPPLTQYQVLMLGAGGAAQGVLLALKEAGIQHLWVANRTAANATALATHAQHLGLAATTIPLNMLHSPHNIPTEYSHTATIMIQASAAGLHGTATVPHPAWLQPVCLAYDMAYPQSQATHTPWQTQLAHIAPSIPSAHGLGMLVYQAWHAFLWWAKHCQWPIPTHNHNTIPQTTLNTMEAPHV